MALIEKPKSQVMFSLGTLLLACYLSFRIGDSLATRKAEGVAERAAAERRINEVEIELRSARITAFDAYHKRIAPVADTVIAISGSIGIVTLRLC